MLHYLRKEAHALSYRTIPPFPQHCESTLGLQPSFLTRSSLELLETL